METYTIASDVDVALFGEHLTLVDQAKLTDQLDRLPIPQRVDLLLHDRVKNQDLVRHVKEHGIEWFNRDSDARDDWQEVELGEFAPFNYGKGLRQKDRDGLGDVPVYGSNGVVGRHDVPLTEGPAVIVGRKGTVGRRPFFT